jgi:aminopeptidase N
MVRVEAARALGKWRSEAAFDALAKAARARHPKVRRAVASALGGFRTPRASNILTALASKDRSYLVGAEASRALGRTRQPGAKKTLLSLAKRRSWGDCFQTGALDGLGNLRDEGAVPDVLSYTTYGQPTRGRRSAIHALAMLADSRRAREHIEDLLGDREHHVRVAAVDALGTLGDPRSRPAMRRALEREGDPRVKRRLREALRETSESRAAERKRLEDDVETLRGEVGELKGRLAKLEAKSPRAPLRGRFGARAGVGLRGVASERPTPKKPAEPRRKR